jgi:hypothetical protein
MSFLGNLIFSAPGLMRTLSALLMALALLPQAKPYHDQIVQLASWIAAGGISRAALRSLFNDVLTKLKAP